MTQRPSRIENHRLEADSENHFNQHLPRDWTSFKPMPDFGVDIVVNIFDGDEATSRELLVQLKSSLEPNSTADDAYERLTLDVSTYNYLWDQLQVVLLVKYVASEQTAYWQLLSQVPEPNQENQTMTVRIPKNQIFNDEACHRIRTYVEYVHKKKLGRRERVDLSTIA